MATVKVPHHIARLILDAKTAWFTRLKAFTLSVAGLMTPDNVNREAGDLLAAAWGSIKGNPLLVDCSGITALSNYALEGIVKIAPATDVPIVFFNITDHVADEIDRELHNHGLPRKVSKQVIPLGDSKVVVFQGGKIRGITKVENLISAARRRDHARVREIVSASFHANEDGKWAPLHSTPILATGVYNARHITCESEQLNWIVLHLEELLNRAIPNWDVSRHCLLSGSLRACPFAGTLAFLSTPPRELEILDHLGPHPVLLEEHDLGPVRQGVEYIYIGDFIVGGTELKIACNWAARRNSRLKHAFAIATLWEEERYMMEEVKIHRLVSLHKLNPNARFSLNES